MLYTRHHSAQSDAGADRVVARRWTADRPFHRIINATLCRTLLRSDCVMLSESRYAAARASIARQISLRQALAVSPATKQEKSTHHGNRTVPARRSRE